MNCCSASSASASVSVTRKSIEAIRSIISMPPREDVREKWPPTRLRIERALPTYITLPVSSVNT